MELNIDVRLIFAILNGKVSAAINRRLQLDFSRADLSLTPEEWTVLLYLSDEDGVTQRRLCRATYRGGAAMSRLITSMERKGLVMRTVMEGNRRANNIYLTPRGRGVRLRAQKVADRTLRDALSGLGHESLSISQEVLRRVFINVTGDDR